MEVDDGGVDKGGELREEELEEGEEGRVVESPRAGGIGVPLPEREGMGNGEPIAVDFEVGAPVGRDEKEFDGGGDEGEPEKLLGGRGAFGRASGLAVHGG